jgi:hypothetical protein
MIAIESITDVLDVARDTSVRAADMEIALYKIGALTAGQQIRSKLNYLELYGFILQSIVDANINGKTYEDLDLTDTSVQTCMDYTYELCTTIFTVDL